VSCFSVISPYTHIVIRALLSLVPQRAWDELRRRSGRTLATLSITTFSGAVTCLLVLVRTAPPRLEADTCNTMRFVGLSDYTPLLLSGHVQYIVYDVSQIRVRYSTSHAFRALLTNPQVSPHGRHVRTRLVP
jgi:hypothetical protein